jgi:tetratricopeptide (TPR) repeat protein
MPRQDAKPGQGPETPESLTEQGVALAKQGQVQQAIGHFRRALELRPGYARAHHNLGIALAEQNRHEEAIQSLCEALRLQPDYVDALYNLGCIYNQLRRRADAIAAYRRALQLKPDHAEVLNNLGLALVYQGQPDEAHILLRQAVRLRPKFLEALNNLGLALTDLGAYREAADSFEQALQLNPRYAEGHTNFGNNFREESRLGEALACYDLALALQPRSVTAHWNRSLVLLQQGDYERGWAEYEWRLQKPDSGLRPLPSPRWDGSPLAGRTLLVQAEQGLGDTIQFIRYAALLQRQGARVIASCPAPLLRLFARCPGIDVLVDEKGTLPSHDQHVPLLSLPALVKTTLATLPAEVPYVSVELSLVERWRARFAEVKGLRVGVCWQGNPRHRKDRERSFALRQLEPLTRVPGVCLINLQQGPGVEQLALRRRFAVVELGMAESGLIWDFTDTAAVMQNLDLVISADTAVAHLAGALGVPVWIALPVVPDWRWLMERDESPWYPSARLFRQQRPGDWEAVFAAMARELVSLAAQNQDRRPGA